MNVRGGLMSLMNIDVDPYLLEELLDAQPSTAWR